MPGAMGSFRKRRWNNALPVVDVTSLSELLGARQLSAVLGKQKGRAECASAKHEPGLKEPLRKNHRPSVPAGETQK